MKWFLKYIKRQWGLVTLGTLMIIISVCLEMLTPYYSKRIIDEVIIGKNLSVFNGIIYMMIGITILRVIFGYIKEISFDKSGSNIIKNLRKDVFSHLQRLPVKYYDKVNTGELISRVKEDTDSIQDAVTFGFMVAFEQIAGFLIGAVVLWYINFKIALLVIAFMPIIAFIAIKYERSIGQVFENISDQRGILNRTAQEGLSGIRLVKSLTREKFEIDKFNGESNKMYLLNVEKSKKVAKYEPLVELVSNIVVLLVIIVGGLLVMNKEISIGTLVACVNYSYTLIWPMRLLGWFSSVIAQAIASIKKMSEIFAEEVEEDENEVFENNIKSYDIKFENVGFNYNDRDILNNINLEIKQGQTVAIMGMSGAGKTSLVNLLTKTYNVTSGKILLGGRDINELSVTELRNYISLVMQDTFLFSASVRDNIYIGVKEFIEEELANSIQVAKVDEFLSSLENDVDTVIGERGIGLSGGQKQRVSIARAVVRKSKILVLDDSTSALDTHTEYDIQRNLAGLHGMTKIIIAHRISATKSADKIVIMDNGTIVEQGSHGELMELKGHYYDTYMEQFKGLLELKEEVVVNE